MVMSCESIERKKGRKEESKGWDGIYRNGDYT